MEGDDGGEVDSDKKAAADAEDAEKHAGGSVGVGRVAMLRASLESRHASSSFRPIVRAV